MIHKSTSIELYFFFLIIVEEYLHNCVQYPPHWMKCVRSHLLKMLYRYICRHVEIRDALTQGVSMTIDDYLRACQLCRSLVKAHYEEQQVPFSSTLHHYQRPQQQQQQQSSLYLKEENQTIDCTETLYSEVTASHLYPCTWYLRYRMQLSSEDGKTLVERSNRKTKDSHLNQAGSFLSGDSDIDWSCSSSWLMPIHGNDDVVVQLESESSTSILANLFS